MPGLDPGIQVVGTVTPRTMDPRVRPEGDTVVAAEVQRIPEKQEADGTAGRIRRFWRHRKHPRGHRQMTELNFVALSTETVRALQAGSPDANSQVPERQISDGGGVPCRHCLNDVAAGEPFLVLAHRPFPEAQPYAETGPIFIHAEPCERHGEAAGVPASFLSRAKMLIRGYGDDDRIVDGTGQVVPTTEIGAVARDLLAAPEVTYLHLRSASNSCYQCRIERGPATLAPRRHSC